MILVTLVAYKVVLLAIGFVAERRTRALLAQHKALAPAVMAALGKISDADIDAILARVTVHPLEDAGAVVVKNPALIGETVKQHVSVVG